MNLLLTFLLVLISMSVIHAGEPRTTLDTLTLPVRIHLMQSNTMPDMHTTLTEADIGRTFARVNKIWEQAAIRFEIESIVRTTATEMAREMRFKSEVERVKSLIPKQRLSQKAIDICYVKRMTPNGFYYDEPVVVKDTAKLNKLPDGNTEQVSRVTAHEMGHVLGLQHQEDTSLLMHTGVTGLSLNQEEIAAARAKAQERLAKISAIEKKGCG